MSGSDKSWTQNSLPLVPTIIGALLFFSLLSRAIPQQADPAGKIEWIDVHVHLIGGRGANADYERTVKAAVKAMDEAGIKKSVVMPPPQVSGMPALHDYDSFISAIRKYPGRFAFLGGGGTLNPMIQDAAGEIHLEDPVRRRFEATADEIIRAGAVGFGEMTAHHLSHTAGHPYESVPADHPLFLVLADRAARYDVVIDFHLDLVTEDMDLPSRFSSPPNPSILRANRASFERFLAHNRKAKVVWAHAGSDFLGHWTVSLSRQLLRKHPNLYMSLRIGGGVPRNLVFDSGGQIKPAWMDLFRDFPDRFVIGGDQFFASPLLRGSGPGLLFAQRGSFIRKRMLDFLSRLPADLARKIGRDNAHQLYKLKE